MEDLKALKDKIVAVSKVLSDVKFIVEKTEKTISDQLGQSDYLDESIKNKRIELESIKNEISMARSGYEKFVDQSSREIADKQQKADNALRDAMDAKHRAELKETELINRQTAIAAQELRLNEKIKEYDQKIGKLQSAMASV